MSDRGAPRPPSAVPNLTKRSSAVPSSGAWSEGPSWNGAKGGGMGEAGGAATNFPPSGTTPMGSSTAFGTDGEALVRQLMMSQPPSSAFSKSARKYRTRTQWYVPVMRIQKETTYVDFHDGHYDGTPMLLFREMDYTTPWGSADILNDSYRRGSTNRLMEKKERLLSRMMNPSPTGGLYFNVDLVGANYLTAVAEPSILTSKYPSDDRDEKEAEMWSRKKVLDMFSFDGICMNQQGGSSPTTSGSYNPLDGDRGTTRIFNVIKMGRSMDTKGMWKNDPRVDEGPLEMDQRLWITCTRNPVSKAGYRVSQMASNFLRPTLPKDMIESLPYEERLTWSPTTCPWTFKTWTSRSLQKPPGKVVQGKDERGIVVPGFAWEVGYVIQPPAYGREGYITESWYDAKSQVLTKPMEIQVTCAGKIPVLY